MLPKMRYRLGLDLGSSSLGWCLIRLNAAENPVAIIRMGVRIFPDGRNPKDGSSLAVTRRLARHMRRRRDRLLKRKARMLGALTDLGFFPKEESTRKSLVDLDPYALRKKGLYEALTGSEYARALFHINQRRGFLSNRKTDSKDSESGALKRAISRLREVMAEGNCQTLGEWLANRHEQDQSVRARLRGKTVKDKAYDFYVDRAMVEHEFDTLWRKQASFNPILFNEKSRVVLKDILLHQRPLLPVKPGRCTLLPDEERAPLALPNTQKFRIYQELNNLRVVNELLMDDALTLTQRDMLAALLNRGDATFAKIRKTLNLSSNSMFNLQDTKRDRLKGNITGAILGKDIHFGERWHTFPHDTQNNIVEKLLNEPSETELVIWLVENTDVDEACAERIASAPLPEGYGSLSRKALSRILPKLIEDTVVYSEAVTRAGFDSHSALSHGQATGEIFEELPYYGELLQRHVAFGTGDSKDSPEKRFGKIANPTVHIGLNQVRVVVNGLIKRYGLPSEVIVEVARDLKIGKKLRDEIQKEQKKNQDRNQSHVDEACAALGLNSVTIDKSKRRDISQKMQLWHELNPSDAANRRCPYTGEQIGLTRLLSDEVEIEHILPYSRTLDDSLNNKTISIRKANRDKGNRAPFEAFGKDKSGEYDYEAILERAALMPKAKGKRFAPDAYEQWLKDDKDFLSRSLNDTAYLSRITKEYVSLICPENRVRAIPGRMTALLRGKFGLNHLLSGSELKNREDHRHHAIDAAVIAVTDQGLLQRFSKASAVARERGLKQLVEEMPLPWPTYRDHVQRSLGTIVVSHKPDHGYQGGMLEDTAWGFLPDGRITRREFVEEIGSRERVIANKQLIPIRGRGVLDRHGHTEDGEPKPYKGYVGGSNYCIEIYTDTNGKWKGDVISTFEAYQVVRDIGEKAAVVKLRHPKLTQKNEPLVMRLMRNDFVKMKVGECYKIMRVVKISSNGTIYFAEHKQSNVDARNRDTADPFKYITKSPESLHKVGASFVSISPIGDTNQKK